MKLEVTEEFVREAYDAACLEWRARIEKEFPSLFPNLEARVKELDEYNWFYGNSVHNMHLKFEQKMIKIPLPKANKEWTLSAWKLAEAILKLDDRWYPYHTEDSTHLILVRN